MKKVLTTNTTSNPASQKHAKSQAFHTHNITSEKQQLASLTAEEILIIRNTTPIQSSTLAFATAQKFSAKRSQNTLFKDKLLAEKEKQPYQTRNSAGHTGLCLSTSVSLSSSSNVSSVSSSPASSSPFASFVQVPEKLTLNENSCYMFNNFKNLSYTPGSTARGSFKSSIRARQVKSSYLN
jgi:hypothetical protein